MFKFELTKEELNTIMAGLGELPAKLSLNMISKLSQEAQKQEQVTPKVEEKKEEKK